MIIYLFKCFNWTWKFCWRWIKNNKNIFFENDFYRSFYKNTKNIFNFESSQDSIIKTIYNHIIYYPTPANLSYFWNFGFLALFCLAIQISSGIFLAMHYIPNVITAFNSVEHIMRDVNSGWFIRYSHANGASAFFAVVYIHIFRGLFYKSYSFSNKSVWISGIIIFIFMMATAFVGYVLPWGQMSFWGATVITNLFSVVPFLGVDLVYWLWGGFSVGGSTLTRFYSFHYLLPFIIVSIVIIHIFHLHNLGSSNPFPLENKSINSFFISFYPYFFIKDMIGLLIFFIFISYYIFFNPNLLGHSDNYIEANSLVTPEHIVPEWYFLPFYAILRSIPNKELGIIAMAFSLIIFIFMPIFDFFYENIIFYFFISSKKSIAFSNIFFFYYSRYFIILIFISIFIMLGVIGARPVEYPYVELGSFLTKSYFIIIITITFLSSTNWELNHNFIFFVQNKQTNAVSFKTSYVNYINILW